jgi:hypothetical protein
MAEGIINRVANSPIVTINLENYFPEQEIVSFDLKDYLFMEMILKEKDFRMALKSHDWSQYEGKILCVYSSKDVIIPVWAYMLVASYASGVAQDVFQGDKDAFLINYYRAFIQNFDVAEFEDKPIVIKGCSKQPVPPAAYLELTAKLKGLAKSIMYGEPCSTVPIYKKPRKV